MVEELIALSYRELAERLGISPDAARMKAKRAAKSGRWRIIPGNHPSDRVMVELPAAELNSPERVDGERGERVGRRTQGRTPDRTEADTITGQMVAALQSAQDRVRELTDQLGEEKDRHRDTAVMLAQAEAGERAAAVEVERLQATVTQLEDDLQIMRRTWWQKLWGVG